MYTVVGLTSLDGDPDKHPNLIPEGRGLSERPNDVVVSENKPQAPLKDPVVLHGQMFGLPIDYVRGFETSLPIPETAMQLRLSGPETNPYFYASNTKE